MVVIATSRTEDKLVQCTENGAHFVVNSKEKDFKEEVMRITEGKGIRKNINKLCHLTIVIIISSLLYVFSISLSLFSLFLTGVDVILDFIGGNYWDNNIASLATGGHIVLLGMVLSRVYN